MKNPLILIIMDGFGIAKDEKKSAINKKTIPHLTSIFQKYPTAFIQASGEYVGLPKGQMGNSEVGHTNIGAGRIVYQELTRITKSINDESFFKNAELTQAFLSAKEKNKSLHLIGLVSNGGVHSHQNHLFALLLMAKKYGLKKVFIHAFLDGRDTPPKSGRNFIKECKAECDKLEIGKIATIVGRYYAMDRDNRWDRTEKAYNAMVNGIGVHENDPVISIENAYDMGQTDEFVEPIICNEAGLINQGDSVVFFNFRPDRARQITRALTEENFDKFKRKQDYLNLNFVCMTQYDESFKNVSVAFKPENINNTLGEYISKKGLTQLRIAETEKYAHVTFFFNGGEEKTFKGEDRILIPSPKVSTYDLKPQMSAMEIKDTVKEKIKNKSYDIIVLNFANCDMVGHSGKFEPTEKAVKVVDNCVYDIINDIIEVGGCAIITADHGNADVMFDENGNPFTAHTTNLVPFCIVGYDCTLQPTGKLADIAPTILKILDLEKPKEMTGQNLIKEVSET